MAVLNLALAKTASSRDARLEDSVDVFLLDDGYQHLRLARDVNILLMDAVRPLGNERLLPAGRLREPVSAMDRADILIITRTGTSPDTEAAIAKLENFPGLCR